MTIMSFFQVGMVIMIIMLTVMLIAALLQGELEDTKPPQRPRAKSPKGK